MIDKNKILEFIKTKNLAVISTINKQGGPEAAVLEFAEREDLTLIIDTLKTSRKYTNLQTDQKVAFVIGWDENITVQLEGRADELSGPELEDAKQTYFVKNPRAKKWGDKPEIAYFAIKPNWVRYSDLNQHPWLVQEFNIPE